MWLLFQEHRVQDWPFIYFCPASRRNCGGNKKENDLVFHQHKEKKFFSFLFYCSCIDRQWRRILAEREKTSSRFLCSLAFIRRHRRCLRCWEKSTLFPPSPVCLRLGSWPFCFYSIAIFLTLILGFPPLQNGEKRERKKVRRPSGRIWCGSITFQIILKTYATNSLFFSSSFLSFPLLQPQPCNNIRNLLYSLYKPSSPRKKRERGQVASKPRNDLVLALFLIFLQHHQPQIKTCGGGKRMKETPRVCVYIDESKWE